MTEPETIELPLPTELAPETQSLLVTPEKILYLYNRRGVRGESSTYVNGLVRGWFSCEAKSRGWASVTWLGDSSCDYPGAGCQLSIRSKVAVISTQPPEHPSVNFDSRFSSSGIEPLFQKDYARRRRVNKQLPHGTDVVSGFQKDYARRRRVNSEGDLSHGSAQAELNAQEDDHTFAFLGYDEMITNLTHLVEILGWKLEPIGEKGGHVLLNNAGHKVLLVQRFNHALLIDKTENQKSNA